MPNHSQEENPTTQDREMESIDWNEVGHILNEAELSPVAYEVIHRLGSLASQIDYVDKPVAYGKGQVGIARNFTFYDKNNGMARPIDPMLALRLTQLQLIEGPVLPEEATDNSEILFKQAHFADFLEQADDYETPKEELVARYATFLKLEPDEEFTVQKNEQVAQYIGNEEVWNGYVNRHIDAFSDFVHNRYPADEVIDEVISKNPDLVKAARTELTQVYKERIISAYHKALTKGEVLDLDNYDYNHLAAQMSQRVKLKVEDFHEPKFAPSPRSDGGRLSAAESIKSRRANRKINKDVKKIGREKRKGYRDYARSRRRDWKEEKRSMKREQI